MKLKFNLSLLVKIQICLSLLFIGFFINYSRGIKKQINLSKKEIQGYRQFFDTYKRVKEPDKETVIASQVTLPEQLRYVPSADSQDIVLKTKKVNIRNVFAPHNPSIIQYDNGYLLFFCYSIADNKDSSYIGCVELDKNFDQTDKEFVKIDTFNSNSEDPRVFRVGKEAYLTYSKNEAYIDPSLPATTMNIASINLENYKIQFATELELNFRLVEKNWTPFEYINSHGQPGIFFQYNLKPHKILELPNPKVNHLLHPVFSKHNTYYINPWEDLLIGWGNLQGGTPALKIDDKYLAFFHSSFSDKDGIMWNVMGAYTFKGSPPFQIISMSPHPILFSGIYDSANLCMNSSRKNIIFPAGFVVGKEGDKEVIHLSCGENDSAIKIVTIDKQSLLKHLKPVKGFSIIN